MTQEHLGEMEKRYLSGRRLLSRTTPRRRRTLGPLGRCASLGTLCAPVALNHVDCAWLISTTRGPLAPRCSGIQDDPTGGSVSNVIVRPRTLAIYRWTSNAPRSTSASAAFRNNPSLGHDFVKVPMNRFPQSRPVVYRLIESLPAEGTSVKVGLAAELVDSSAGNWKVLR